jgi:metal-responsive CopG/Arc/MetJ family transcriptional regulator
MRATVTVSLPPVLRRELGRVAKGQGMTESESVRRAVQRQIWADAFEKSRRILVPKARAPGYLHRRRRVQSRVVKVVCDTNLLIAGMAKASVSSRRASSWSF